MRTRCVRRRCRSMLCVAGILVCCFESAAFAQTIYSVVDLGTLGGDNTVAHAISAEGDVTGSSAPSGSLPYHAFFYRRSDGMMFDAGTFGGDFSAGLGISNGVVTGGAYGPGNLYTRAFTWTPGSPMKDLGTLGGVSSSGSAINSLGQVTGSSRTTDNTAHAFLYSGGAMTDVGTLGGNYSNGYGINAAGELTGDSSLAGDVNYHAYIYTGGVMIDLGTLGGAYSAGYGINTAGQVAGFSYMPGNVTIHAFLYSAGVMTDLGTLGGDNSAANSINSTGHVVGASYVAAGGTHAFVYTPAGGMVDLNSMIPGNPEWTLEGATGINDVGEISGYGWVSGRSGQHAFLLVPSDATIEALMAAVDALGLADGPERSLQAKLEAAAAAAARGSQTAAVNQLQAFMNEVEAMKKRGSLTAAEADPLLELAEAVAGNL